MRGLHAGRDPSAVPVHGELGDQGDIRVVRSRLVLIVQEVQVGPVDGETLPPELVTQVVLVQLGELLLQLKHRRGGLGTEGRPGGAQGPAPRALSLSPLDAAGGQTQKGSLAVFIFLCSFQSNFKKGQQRAALARFLKPRAFIAPVRPLPDRPPLGHVTSGAAY